MSTFKYQYILIFSIIIFSVKSSKDTKIFQLSGNDVDEAIQNAMENSSKLFIIFHIKSCPYCHYAIKVLKEDVIKNYNEEDNIKFMTVNLDLQENIWLGSRFNITRIPYIILIEGKRMYYFDKQFDEDTVTKFINEEKNYEDSFAIPAKVNFFDKFTLINKEITGKIAESIKKISDKIGVKIYWNTSLTIILLFVIFIVIFYIEQKTIKFLCKLFGFDKKPNENKNEETVGNELNKDKKEENKEEKKEGKKNDEKKENKNDSKERKNKKVKKE